MERSESGLSRSRFSIFTLLFLFAILPWGRAAQAATVDVMLVYDTTATAWVGSNGGMAAFSQDAVNRMNLAMQNSGVSISFRLVHSMSVDYKTQSSQSTPLTADLTVLQAGNGAFAAVAAARDTYGADLVAMLVDHGSSYGYVGQGYLLSSWSGHANYAHTVNAIRSVAISHTLTHEVGHNLGAHHAKDQTSDRGPNLNLDGQYSAGWYFTGTNGTAYHSIMAYGDDGFGKQYNEAPLFSTPLKTYQGTPAGDAANGDNARLLRETGGVVAAYRAAENPTPTIPAVPVALAATDITSTSFMARWSAVSGAKGYWLDVSTSNRFDLAGESFEVNVGNATSYVFDRAIPNTPFYYRVRAYNDSGMSDHSNVVYLMTADDAGFGRYGKQVYVMYAGYFGRPPAPTGFDYYENWMEKTGGDYRLIVDDFFKSLESQALYGPLSTEQKISLVFRSLFARSPLSDGLTYWKGMVDTSRISVAEMAYTIAYNAAPADEAVLNAKSLAAAAFVGELARVQKLQGCSMDIDYGREFLDSIRTQANADEAILSIGSTVAAMCQ